MRSRLLPDLPDHLSVICPRLGLGMPVQPLQPVTGGFHHMMWRLDTDTGSYAIKQLGADSALSYRDLAGHYNATEAAAMKFAQLGLPALHAIPLGDDFLQQLENEAYLVYPWTDAEAAHRDRISDEQNRRVAEIMALMHRADIGVPELGQERPNFLSGDRLLRLVREAHRGNVRDTRELEAHLDRLLQITRDHAGAIATVAEKRVVSHGDLDHKNVLWTAEGEPLIIDWESTRLLNPTHELLLEALDWSGITGEFRMDRFRQFIAAYQLAGGEYPQDMLWPALQCVLADWVNWLMYNVGRALDQDHSELRQMSSEQIDLALSTILRIEKLMPRLQACLM